MAVLSLIGLSYLMLKCKYKAKRKDLLVIDKVPSHILSSFATDNDKGHFNAVFQILDALAASYLK